MKESPYEVLLCELCVLCGEFTFEMKPSRSRIMFGEIVTMALSSLGANKLRTGLTMMGITIGVFSVISVMTAVGALQNSIETGLTLFGSNIFQFAKFPPNVNAGGAGQKKYENRRNITYAQALRYGQLM
ncbi:MAG: hypothetical protein DLM52_08935, partial [Chthoniobacterales bacterium]